MVNGKMVFNSYRYSSSTGKQQSKVKQLIDGTLNLYPARQNGIDVEIPGGLQAINWVEDGIKYATSRIAFLESKQATGKPGSSVYECRQREINGFKNQVKFLKTVKEPVTA